MTRSPYSNVSSSPIDISATHDLEAHVAEPPPTTEIASCVEEEHPTLAGRALCRFDRTNELQAWLPCLMHVRPRKGDRVLVTRCPGAPHGLVVGVVDGYRDRLLPTPRLRAAQALSPDDVLTIEDARGTAVLELRADEGGTRVQLLHPNVKFVGEGEISFEARKVSITATQGPVLVGASEDVRVHGEQIHLNS